MSELLLKGLRHAKQVIPSKHNNVLFYYFSSVFMIQMHESNIHLNVILLPCMDICIFS
jgi:hypothetical protein